MEENLVLGCVVGHREVNLEDILGIFSGRGDEYDASPCAINHEGSIKEQCLVLKSLSGGRAWVSVHSGRKSMSACDLTVVLGWKLSSNALISTSHFAILPVAS